MVHKPFHYSSEVGGNMTLYAPYVMWQAPSSPPPPSLLNRIRGYLYSYVPRHLNPLSQEKDNIIYSLSPVLVTIGF